ncbi:hypothetical protein [Nocardia rhamnosiphila]|uniref:hypothetical protein n=1 Tax=Nocardia rhamnosiphila TaxID=426716 RepID=UPI003F4D380E
MTSSVDDFYGKVVQPLREWTPTAPKQAEPLLSAAADVRCVARLSLKVAGSR